MAARHRGCPNRAPYAPGTRVPLVSMRKATLTCWPRAIRTRPMVWASARRLYTAALSVGTVAWIGTGEQYERP